MDAAPPHPEPGADSPPPALFDLGAAFDSHGGTLLGYSVNALRDRALAEDCVQETFLRAWRRRDSFDPSRGGLRTWLFAIMRNVIVDVQRAQQRLPRIAVDDELGDVVAPVADTLDRLLIVEALAKPSDDHRRAFVAVHLEGETYADLSARTGVPVATLRTRVFYAVRALRTHIDGEEGRA